MTDVIEDTGDKIRNLPIDDRLRRLLQRAGDETGIQGIRVTSGGQCAKGTCRKRTGSTRHDLGQAADLELWKNGRALDFTKKADLPVFRAFVAAAARLGASGIGAGIGYMGPNTIHVGFGAQAVWGKGGSSAEAPEWLREAAKEGWANAVPPISRTYRVAARAGLHLRAGPGESFNVLSTVEAGTVIGIEGYDGADEAWARVDLRNDGWIDGHLHRAFLQPVDLVEGDGESPQDDCGSDQ